MESIVLKKYICDVLRASTFHRGLEPTASETYNRGPDLFPPTAGPDFPRSNDSRAPTLDRSSRDVY